MEKKKWLFKKFLSCSYRFLYSLFHIERFCKTIINGLLLNSTTVWVYVLLIKMYKNNHCDLFIQICTSHNKRYIMMDSQSLFLKSISFSLSYLNLKWRAVPCTRQSIKILIKIIKPLMVNQMQNFGKSQKERAVRGVHDKQHSASTVYLNTSWGLIPQKWNRNWQWLHSTVQSITVRMMYSECNPILDWNHGHLQCCVCVNCTAGKSPTSSSCIRRPSSLRMRSFSALSLSSWVWVACSICAGHYLYFPICIDWNIFYIVANLATNCFVPPSGVDNSCPPRLVWTAASPSPDGLT